MAARRAVFLDRDGTLVKAYDNRPANHPDEIALLPGVPEGLKRLRDAGYTLVVVTNQGGIGLGHISREDLADMNDRLNDLVAMAKGEVPDAYYWCPHKPSEGCDCRKPKPGMLLRAAAHMNIDLANSFMIGDDVRDMQAAQAAGLRKKVMVVSDRYVENTVADIVCSNFKDAVESVIRMGLGQ